MIPVFRRSLPNVGLHVHLFKLEASVQAMLQTDACKAMLQTNACKAMLQTDAFKAMLQTDACYSNLQTAKPVKPGKRKGVIERDGRFVDFVRVTVRGGKGGDGLQSFSSLPNQEWAGPDGGNGGNGGHVVFTARSHVKSLSHLKPVIRARDGVKGKTRKRDGKNADHLHIEVPLGTIVRTEDGESLTSLDRPEDIFIAARGGAGGRGNSFFLSNETRAPTISEPGGLGQERNLSVELKTMAHAGLIGFPNAGKSSLLQAISRAQPKISPYPFTTLNPHVGMVLYDDHVQLAVADIPGLIPGSYENRGMGISFLRHIERCLCLVYVIDLALEQPWEQLYRLHFELEQYQEGLSKRPSVLVGNKMDLPGAEERMERLKEKVKTDGMIISEESADADVSDSIDEENDLSQNVDSVIILGVSAKRKTGMDEFLHHLRVLYDKHSVKS